MKKHKKRKSYYTPEKISWYAMISRCYNKNSKMYYRYGGRGITVCERWKNSFDLFIEDMGKQPYRELEFDRIDNEGNYEPSNCRWVSRTENARNRSTTKLSISKAKEIRKLSKKINVNELARKYSVSNSTIYSIINNKIWKEVV